MRPLGDDSSTSPPVSSWRADSPRCLLAVDGIDGSGKSRLAARLAAAAADAGIASLVLPVDDFRRPVDWRAGDRTEAAIYYDDYYDLALLDRCLGAFVAGAGFVDIPVYDVAAHRLNGERRIVFAGASLAIVEGIFALRIANVSASAGVIYLRTSFATAHDRVLARDTARGRSSADVAHRIAARYFPSQERYLRECDPVARAEVVIDNEDWRAPSVVHLDGRMLQSRLGGASGAAVTAAVSAALMAFATPAAVG